jgi:hypothetical protein
MIALIIGGSIALILLSAYGRSLDNARIDKIEQEIEKLKRQVTQIRKRRWR